MSAEKPEQTIEAGAEVTVASKNQKKAIKALKGTGVKKVDGITRVVLRKRQGVVLVVEQPEVYRTPNGSYVVFGEAHVQTQDYQQQLAALTGNNGANAPAAGAEKTPEAIQADLAANVDKLNVADEEEDVPDAEVDTTGLDDDTLEMVMDQANVSKAKAAKALRENNGDLVNSLLQLTT